MYRYSKTNTARSSSKCLNFLWQFFSLFIQGYNLLSTFCVVFCNTSVEHCAQLNYTLHFENTLKILVISWALLRENQHLHWHEATNQYHFDLDICETVWLYIIKNTEFYFVHCMYIPNTNLNTFNGMDLYISQQKTIFNYTTLEPAKFIYGCRISGGPFLFQCVWRHYYSFPSIQFHW